MPRAFSVPMEDVMLSNADVVHMFLEEHRGVRYSVGDAFVLPDIEQEYRVTSVRPFSHDGKVYLYLDLEAVCAVAGCDNKLQCSVDVALWRGKPTLRRCCPDHLYGFRSPVEGAWLTIEQREQKLGERDASAARKQQRDAVLARRRAESSRGRNERAVLASKEDMEALGLWPVSDEALVGLSIAKLPRGDCARDTRKQQVVRALAALRRRGEL